MSENTLPAQWNTGEMLDGLDLTDKSELVGTPFRIMSVMFRSNKNGVEIVEVDAELTDGTMVTFNDSSSTGVREQIADYLTTKGTQITAGEIYEISLVIPRGLRVSNYTIEVRGKERPATTYYLTTSGLRNSRNAPVTVGKSATK